ncbi:2-dehydropantoate 2-reductase [Paenibacillus sp. M1]|uniref:2-dehydropantoate 2-reductase n=1 Tax=Paenibacillus haidiansis TaxID=1574488 RepID=A0ABU7VLP5_9BACL
MSVVIVGAGALGMLYGGLLAAAGVQVVFWTRTSGQAELLRKQGLMIESADGGAATTISPDKFAARSLEERGMTLGGDPEWVFLTVKQRHIDDKLLDAVRNLMGTETKIVAFQNGVGHIDKLRQVFPGLRVYAAITTEGAKRTSPRTVVRAGLGETKIGIPKGPAMHEADHSDVELDSEAEKSGESLIMLLAKAGFPAFLSNDIDKDIYRKLLINAVINPLTALLRIPNGELLAAKQREELMLMLCREGELVYRTYGIPYDPDMFEVIASVCRSTSGNLSSMLKDVLEGAPTEIDYINGRLVEMARAANVQIPVHETVWRLVRALPLSGDIKL